MTLKEKFSEFTKKESWEKENYNAKECEQIADDYAIEFALFLSKECETNGDKDGWWFYNKTWKTTNELLEIFKKEKGL
jgi:hypothetical protein